VPTPARIVTIPSTDAEFAADVGRVAALLPSGLSAPDAVDWFRVALRRAHPSAVVREQDELARIEGAEPVWYVTRREHHFRIDTSVLLPLPPSDAFEVYVDRMTEWQSAVELVARHLEPGIVGNEYDATYTFLGRRFHGLFRILAAHAPEFVSVEASGSGITVWYVVTFTSQADGTIVRVKGDYDLPFEVVARIADRLGLERSITRDIERANESYRRLAVQVHPAV
jgi:hypothetical protein